MEMEPVLPAMPAEPTPSRRTCIPLEQGRLQLEGDGLLCRTCQHHQSILLQLLSAYESPAGMDEEREAAHYQRHRQDLERRYPLCGACRARVQERLRVVEYKVRGRRLATRDKSSQALEVRKKRDAVLWIRTIMLVDVFFVQIAMFGGAWLVDFFDQRIGDWPSQTVLLVLARAAVTLLAGTLAIRYRRNAFKLMCLAILLFFRLVSLNLVADGLLYTRDIRSLPFIVLNVASLALLVQIYQAQRRSVTSPTDSATRIGSSGGGRHPLSQSIFHLLCGFAPDARHEGLLLRLLHRLGQDGGLGKAGSHHTPLHPLHRPELQPLCLALGRSPRIALCRASPSLLL